MDLAVKCVNGLREGWEDNKLNWNICFSLHCDHLCNDGCRHQTLCPQQRLVRSLHYDFHYGKMLFDNVLTICHWIGLDKTLQKLPAHHIKCDYLC